MAGGNIQGFDPSVKGNLQAQDGNKGVGMDWNQNNIAREADSYENVGKALGVLGDKMQRYAIHERDTQMQADIVAINQFRATKYKEVLNALAERTDINDKDSYQKEFERLTALADDAVDKEYKANARWYDDSVRFVQAESRETATMALAVGFGQLIEKNNKRTENIAQQELSNGYEYRNFESVKKAVSMFSKFKTPEEMEYLKKEIRRNWDLNEVKHNLESIQSISNPAEKREAMLNFHTMLNDRKFRALTDGDYARVGTKLNATLIDFDRHDFAKNIEAEYELFSIAKNDEERATILEKIGKSIDDADFLLEGDRNLHKARLDSVRNKKDVNIAYKYITTSLNEIQARSSIDYVDTECEKLKEYINNSEALSDEDKLLRTANVDKFQKDYSMQLYRQSLAAKKDADSVARNGVIEMLNDVRNTGVIDTGKYTQFQGALTEGNRPYKSTEEERESFESVMRSINVVDFNKEDKDGGKLATLAMWTYNNINDEGLRKRVFQELFDNQKGNGVGISKGDYNPLRAFAARTFGNGATVADYGKMLKKDPVAMTVYRKLQDYVADMGYEDSDIEQRFKDDNFVLSLQNYLKSNELLKDKTPEVQIEKISKKADALSVPKKNINHYYDENKVVAYNMSDEGKKARESARKEKEKIEQENANKTLLNYLGEEEK